MGCTVVPCLPRFLMGFPLWERSCHSDGWTHGLTARRSSPVGSRGTGLARVACSSGAPPAPPQRREDDRMATDRLTTLH